MKRFIMRTDPASRKNLLTIVLMITCIALVWGSGACASSPMAFARAFPPMIPAECYNCIEVLPQDLNTSYFSGYANSAQSEALYNNQYFVFKDLVVKDWVIQDIDEGVLWAGSGIKCILVENEYSKNLKLEDRIDVVGLNTGVISYETPGLLFKDCYVLPAGALKLPSGAGGGFSAGY